MGTRHDHKATSIHRLDALLEGKRLNKKEREDLRLLLKVYDGVTNLRRKRPELCQHEPAIEYIFRCWTDLRRHR